MSSKILQKLKSLFKTEFYIHRHNHIDRDKTGEYHIGEGSEIKVA